MMQESLALRVAIEFLRRPSRVWSIRSSPLPSGVGVLLRIATGDVDAESDAVKVTGKPIEVIRSAAEFFIEQILFHSEADSYRVLGVNPSASSTELRQNMALLMRWLHPDVEQQAARSLFATNVTNAWNDLKTDERRALYDSTHVVTKGRSIEVHSLEKRAQAVHSYRMFIDYGAKRGFMRNVWFYLIGRTKS